MSITISSHAHGNSRGVTMLWAIIILVVIVWGVLLWRVHTIYSHRSLSAALTQTRAQVIEQDILHTALTLEKHTLIQPSALDRAAQDELDLSIPLLSDREFWFAQALTEATPNRGIALIDQDNRSVAVEHQRP